MLCSLVLSSDLIRLGYQQFFQAFLTREEDFIQLLGAHGSLLPERLD